MDGVVIDDYKSMRMHYFPNFFKLTQGRATALQNWHFVFVVSLHTFFLMVVVIPGTSLACSKWASASSMQYITYRSLPSSSPPHLTLSVSWIEFWPIILKHAFFFHLIFYRADFVFRLDSNSAGDISAVNSPERVASRRPYQYTPVTPC